MSAFDGWSDAEIAAYARTVEPMIERLCALAERVGGDVHGWKYATDCICGSGGMWPERARPSLDWRHDGKSIEFIERVVNAAIDNPEILMLIKDPTL